MLRVTKLTDYATLLIINAASAPTGGASTM
jgi:hypothetical protein